LYAGEQLDPNVGFYYLRARYYSQATGRFITTDPFQGNIFEPVSLHRYLYAKANPLFYADPSGESPLALVAIGVISALLSGLYIIGSALTNPGSDDRRGRTNEFRIRFCSGGTLITGIGGGGLNAVIAENRSDGKAESALYSVATIGLGLAFGLFSDGQELTFTTKVKKNVKSFTGFGLVGSGGLAAVVAGSTVEGFVLPDGTPVNNSSLLSLGLSTIEKGKVLSVGAFVSLTYWQIVSTNQSLYLTGTLRCP